MFLPHPVNGAHSNRHDTALRRGVTGAREVNPAKPDREAQRPQGGQACASPHGDGRENKTSARQVVPPIRQMAVTFAPQAHTRGELPGGFGGRV
jgi:hypothetical protein